MQRVNEIVHARRGVTPETAWLFAEALGTSPEFWLNLQTNYDLVRFRPKLRSGTHFGWGVRWLPEPGYKIFWLQQLIAELNFWSKGPVSRV